MARVAWEGQINLCPAHCLVGQRLLDWVAQHRRLLHLPIGHIPQILQTTELAGLTLVFDKFFSQ